MIRKEKIEQMVTEFLQETDRFLVKVSVGKDNMINVYIDGDSGVTIAHCVQLSRHIEGILDRDTEDFELNVSSAGVGEPFLLPRQYQNNLGKPVEVLMNDGTKKRGILDSADEHQIVLKEEEKQKKKKSKKMVVGEPLPINMSDIKKAKAVIIF
jgi:ribosome maturation factor RimP